MNVIRKTAVLVLLLATVFVNPSFASRYQYSLQRFNTGNLTVFTTVIKEDGCKYGVILDPDGYLHTVILGDYIGKNNGKVISITKDGVEVEEVHAAGEGNWALKKVLLRIKDTQNK